MDADAAQRRCSGHFTYVSQSLNPIFNSTIRLNRHIVMNSSRAKLTPSRRQSSGVLCHAGAATCMTDLKLVRLALQL